MKAAVLVAPGVVEIREVPVPEPGPGELLVRARACGLNRADTIMASGHMHGAHGGPGTILGLECAGEAVSVGDGVAAFAAGDRVMGSGQAAFAEYVVVHATRAFAVPAHLDWRQAATFPIAVQTMHDAIVTNGRQRPGESVLIQGASSGVGLMGMQIAKLLGAGLVIGTSTNPERRSKLAEFGADLALDAADPDWPKAARDAAHGRGIDLIVDQVSGAMANQNLRAAAILGRIVNVGRLGGMKGEFDFDLHALKRIAYIGVTFRTRTPEEVGEIVRRAGEALMPAIEAGRLSLPIDRAFPLEGAGAALDYMRANRHFGKIVLDV